MQNLLQLTYDLVSISSVSYEEENLANFLEEKLKGCPWLNITRIANNVICRTERNCAARVVLAGHLDTVPFAGNDFAEMGIDYVSGRGSADMKGGVAVLMAIAMNADQLPVDTTFVFYAKEEVKRIDSGLLEIESEAPDLLKGDLAVLAEPTNGAAEVGCQGVIRVDLLLGGKAAHTARPWTGTNAIHRLSPVIETIARFGYHETVIDNVVYKESLQVLKAEGGRGGNVVPDRLNVTIGYRFAPGRSVAQAYELLQDLFQEILDDNLGDKLSMTESAPAAEPHLSHLAIQKLIKITSKPPVAKLGWTDVAFFAERNIPAVNFGPADPELAHGPHETVHGFELDNCYEVLWELLSTFPQN